MKVVNIAKTIALTTALSAFPICTRANVSDSIVKPQQEQMFLSLKL
mgnify:CR=1 FL=1